MCYYALHYSTDYLIVPFNNHSLTDVLLNVAVLFVSIRTIDRLLLNNVTVYQIILHPQTWSIRLYFSNNADKFIFEKSCFYYDLCVCVFAYILLVAR